MRNPMILAAGLLALPACVDVPHRDFVAPTALDAASAIDALPDVAAPDALPLDGPPEAPDADHDAAVVVDAGVDGTVIDALAADVEVDAAPDAAVVGRCGLDGVYFAGATVCLRVERVASLVSARAGHTMTREGARDRFVLIGGDRGVPIPRDDAPIEEIPPAPPIAEELDAEGAVVQSEVLLGLGRERFEHTAHWIPASAAMGPELAAPEHLLLLGGRLTPDGIPRTAAALWDPATRLWTLPDVGLVEARAGHGAAALGRGRMLLVGGERVSLPRLLARAERYRAHPVEPGRWTARAEAKPSQGDDEMTERWRPVITRLDEGVVMWGGGEDVEGAPVGRWVIYDIGHMQDHVPPAFDGPAVVGAEVVTLGEPVDEVLLYGGAIDGVVQPGSHRYRVLDGTWSSRAALAARVGHTATRIGDAGAAWVVLIGGADSLVELVDESDPADPRVLRGAATRGPLARPRSGHRAARLADGRVVLTGGRVDGAVSDDVLVLTWLEQTP